MSTHSVEFEGYPFGSLVPYCLDATGRPLLLLSHLAQHTRNLAENPKASFTVVGPITGDVQQAERLVAVGEVEAMPDASLGERYFRYYPDSRYYAEALSFRFYRFQPLRWHFNGGFATARWFGNDQILADNPFDEPIEARLVADVNANDRDTLGSCLAKVGIPVDADSVRLCGVDARGMDIAVGALIHRIKFSPPVVEPSALRQRLAEMAIDG
jgi:putative heme iron utilization protein